MQSSNLTQKGKLTEPNYFELFTITSVLRAFGWGSLICTMVTVTIDYGWSGAKLLI